jgi:hypothetical protein
MFVETISPSDRGRRDMTAPGSPESNFFRLMVLAGRLTLLALVDELGLVVTRELLVRCLFHTCLSDGFRCGLISISRFARCVGRG